MTAHTPTLRHAPAALFVLEQTLGHRTHSANLRELIPEIGGIDPVFLPIEFDAGGHRFPGWSNWTVRAGVRAHRSVFRLIRSDPPIRPDVMFVHTQVPAVLLGTWMRRIPTVVSLDATPLQFDQLGTLYRHERGADSVERLKHRMNRRCFERAAHIVTWSEWAKRGLVDGYGIDPQRITAIAPGVNLDRWRPRQERRHTDGRVRVLFVGADLQRKGGDVLIQAVRELRRADSMDVELHLVTTASIDPEPGVVVHEGVGPNSAELIALYQSADIFCLPTLGDCLPMVLAEAAAVGLPLVASDVGAVGEIVRSGETGELMRPGDVTGLVGALRTLVRDEASRHEYGLAARRLAERCHDARANAATIVDLLLRTVPEPDG
jgi:glycosyltransferase involved in cell wall biosynthesis